MKYIVITVADSDEAKTISNVLREAEEEGIIDFAFNYTMYNSIESAEAKVGPYGKSIRSTEIL